MPDHRGLRHPRGTHLVGAESRDRRGASRTTGVLARPSRLRALVRDRRSRSRLHGHAVGVARAGDARGNEIRHACRDRGPRGDDHRRLLGACGDRRKIPPSRRDDGELQLRSARDAGAEHRPAGSARRCAPRGRRLSPRSSRDQIREEGRRTLAPRMVAQTGSSAVARRAAACPSSTLPAANSR